MKNIKITLDYKDIGGLNNVVCFYVDGELRLNSNLEFPNNYYENESEYKDIEFKKDFEFQLEDNENLTMIFYELDELEFRYSFIACFIGSFLGSIGSILVNGENYSIYQYLSICHKYDKLFIFTSESDAEYEVACCEPTRKHPILCINVNKMSNGKIESEYAKCDYKKAYRNYKLAVIASAIVLCIVGIISGWFTKILGAKTMAKVCTAICFVAGVMHIIRSLWNSHREFKKLKKNNWNLDVFTKIKL